MAQDCLYGHFIDKPLVACCQCNNPLTEALKNCFLSFSKIKSSLYSPHYVKA